MCRPLELVFSNGFDSGEQISVKTGEISELDTFDKFFEAYSKQMEYNISLLVNADNAIDTAHAERCPLPFLSAMVDDCISRGKTPEQGGAVYNFTGPQGFGIANIADSLYAVKTLVYEQKKITLSELKDALEHNFGETSAEISAVTEQVVLRLRESGIAIDEKTAKKAYEELTEVSPEDKRRREIRSLLLSAEKYGNDSPEVDALARKAAYTYTAVLEKFGNPRGGIFQAGLYPVSANVPLGAQTGATPDGRLAHKPVADGVSPSAGCDVHGPTAAANSVAKLDHSIASNGTLFNMKFHPSALQGQSGIDSFIALIRGYFDQKGSHMQFNVVSRDTLKDAQAHPEKYRSLVVRVAGYSALFTTLSKSLQDDIINRTEQMGF